MCVCVCVCARACEHIRAASVRVRVRAFALKDRPNIKKDQEGDTGVTRNPLEAHACVHACARLCMHACGQGKKKKGRKKDREGGGGVTGNALEAHVCELLRVVLAARKELACHAPPHMSAFVLLY